MTLPAGAPRGPFLVGMGESDLFLAALGEPEGEPIRIDAGSTAEALVFSHPSVAVLGSEVGEGLRPLLPSMASYPALLSRLEDGLRSGTSFLDDSQVATLAGDAAYELLLHAGPGSGLASATGSSGMTPAVGRNGGAFRLSNETALSWRARVLDLEGSTTAVSALSPAPVATDGTIAAPAVVDLPILPSGPWGLSVRSGASLRSDFRADANLLAFDLGRLVNGVLVGLLSDELVHTTCVYTSASSDSFSGPLALSWEETLSGQQGLEKAADDFLGLADGAGCLASLSKGFAKRMQRMAVSQIRSLEGTTETHEPARIVQGLTSGADEALRLLLEAGSASDWGAGAGLLVTSEPSGAGFSLAGEPAGATPVQLLDLAAGETTVKLEASGYEPETRTLSLEDGVWTSLHVALSPVSEEPDPPVIAVGPASLTFSVEAGAAPTSADVTVSNAGEADLTGLSVGDNAGWLSATLAGTEAPTSVQVVADPSGLAAGTYQATVTVASSLEGVSSVEVPVSLTVVASEPDPAVIAVDPTSLSFGFAHDEGAASRNVSVSNAGEAALTGLSAEVNFGAAVWMTAVLSSTSAPATLQVTVDPATLDPGSYDASVTLSSSAEGVAPVVIPVTVTVDEPPPPPAPSVRECDTPDAAWIFCDDFEDDRLADYFEVSTASGSLTRATGVGQDGSWGMRARWTAGQVNAGSMKLAFGKTPDNYIDPVDAGTQKYREVYWRVYLRHQDGWVGGGGDKLSRAMGLVSSNWAQSMIAHVWSGGSGNNYLLIDPASGTDEAGNLKSTKYNDWPNLRWLGLRTGPTPLFDSSHVGQWYCIETRVRLNDAGQSNGVFQLWIDGSIEASRTDLNWVGAYDAYGINAIFLEHYWNAGSPVTQERYMDRFVVSTQPIGC